MDLGDIFGIWGDSGTAAGTPPRKWPPIVFPEPTSGTDSPAAWGVVGQTDKPSAQSGTDG